MNPFYIWKYDVIALMISLTQCGITWEESLIETLLSRSSESLSKSVENCGRRACPQWVAPFPNQGILYKSGKLKLGLVIYAFILLLLAIHVAVSSSCCLEFPTVMECNLKL